MNKEKVNKLADEYLYFGNKDAVGEIYKEIMIYHSKVGIPFCKRYQLPLAEIESSYGIVLLRLMNVYSGGDFTNLLTKSLRNERNDILRKYIRRREIETLVDYNDNQVDEVLKEYLIDDVYLNKKEEEQRQLLFYLCDPSKVDNVTTAIVTNFSRYSNINTLAKALGLHHETVKRKLRKIANNFDEQQFGDYRDYLAV